MKPVNPLRVACPSCGQPPGRECVDLAAGLPSPFAHHAGESIAPFYAGHDARRVKAERLSADESADGRARPR